MTHDSWLEQSKNPFWSNDSTGNSTHILTFSLASVDPWRIISGAVELRWTSGTVNDNEDDDDDDDVTVLM